MRHLVNKGSKLGRKPDHRKLLLRNMATSLVEHGRITTTQAKAGAVQPLVERVITHAKGKENERELIRYLKTQLLTEAAQKKVVSTIKERYKDRAGGYTRISPVKVRKGDGTMTVQLELV